MVLFERTNIILAMITSLSQVSRDLRPKIRPLLQASITKKHLSKKSSITGIKLQRRKRVRLAEVFVEADSKWAFFTEIFFARKSLTEAHVSFSTILKPTCTILLNTEMCS